jgi:hypothetical protein
MKPETITEFAARTGRKPDTVYRLARRKFPAETWTLNSAVTPELSAMLSGKVPAEKPAVVRVSVPAPSRKNIASENKAVPETPMAKAPARAAFPKLPTLDLSEFLIVAVYGHTLLVWYEIATIFGMPGALAGVVVFAMTHAALMICRNERLMSLASDALGVAFVLDALAWYVHYTAFADAMPARIVAQMGATGAAWSAGVLGLVVAAGAFVAIVLVKNLMTNKVFQI